MFTLQFLRCGISGWRTILLGIIISTLMPIAAVILSPQSLATFQSTGFASSTAELKANRQQTQTNHPKFIEFSMQLATAYQTMGDYEQARKVLQETWSRAQLITPENKVLLTSQLSDVLLAMQQPDEAVNHLKQIVPLARRLNSPLILAHVLNNLGNALYVLEDYSKAITLYLEATELAIRAGDLFLHIEVLNNLGLVQLQLKNSPASLATLETAWSEVQKLTPTQNKTYALLSLAQLALRIHKQRPQTLLTTQSLLTAYQILDTARQLAEQQQDNRALSYTKGLLGEVYTRQQRYSEAQHLTQQAIFFAQTIPDILYLWEGQQAHLLQAQGKLTAAATSYRQALEHLHPIRTRLFIGQRDTDELFAEWIRPIYLGFADVLLQQAAQETTKIKTTLLKQAQAAQETANKVAKEVKAKILKQARENLELLKSVELQEYFKIECVGVENQAIALEEHLDQQTAVLYPIILPDRLELLFTTAKKVHQVVVPVDADTLTTTVNKFRTNLQFSVSNRFIKQAKQLYEWLITPLEAQLTQRGIQTLVIVPDGILRTIPFAALYNARDKKFLLHQLALAVTPSLNLTNPKPLNRTNLRISLNGLSAAVQNFPALPNVITEINQIENLFPHHDVLLDQTFVLEKFNQQIARTPYEIVHIASHGQFDRDPKKTFLLTYDDKLTLDRLQSLLGFSQIHQNSVELLTLSACQTAVGDELAALGLAGVAIKAGAESAIASLWFVDDESTSQLIVEFYRNLLSQPQWSRAKALQQAQQKLAATSAYRHPAYWAPFLLIGNWL
jgi:CHAT domain-containing protein